MHARDLAQLGIPKGPAMKAAIRAVAESAQLGMEKQAIRTNMANVSANPKEYLHNPQYGALAAALIETRESSRHYKHREVPASYKQWGTDIDPGAIEQMENALKLPVSVSGALMPDAHVGYGLPIGGVLAVDNVVIPYAVGVDIACRMKMTVLDLPPSALKGQSDRLRKAIERETRFGVGATFQHRREHEVMDMDWRFSPEIHVLKDKAWSQLGTSGSGNHFVEFGTLSLAKAAKGLEAGTYLALLSHSGSRGTGAMIADRFSKLAMRLRPELPPELKQLAWLDLDKEEGQQYWNGMQLMGNYAAANHELIHRHIAKNLGADVLLDVENHHNFAWKETHDGKEVIVHRKGATPAGAGVMGIIPGSMGTPGYLVAGKGDQSSLHSASHGAGRRMSRNAARQAFTWKDVKEFLKERDVTLMSAGLDEVPMAYKDIESVMAAQSDLVEVVARFDPKLVKMAEAGERPED